jgi:hypothetical protein
MLNGFFLSSRNTILRMALVTLIFWGERGIKFPWSFIGRMQGLLMSAHASSVNLEHTRLD